MLADMQHPQKVTVGDDGCHSRQWEALFYYGNCYIESTCFEI